MRILANYLYAYLKSMSFMVAFVFFAMDMSGIWGGWGYTIYYPLIFFIAIYCFKNQVRVGVPYVLFLLICLLSIIINDIPAYYHVPFRYIAFVLLMASFSSLFNSRKIALMRLHLFHLFSILSVILVSVNFILLKLGRLDSRQYELYQATGLYAGSTGNNEMGLLAAIAIMFIVVFYIKHRNYLSRWESFIMLGCLICSISMMALSSSRMGLICTVISILVVIFKLNRGKGQKIVFAIIAFLVAMVVTANLFSDKFKYMMQKNENQLTSLNVNSRDEMWKSRLKEFNESPVFGVGFAYMKYGWGAADAAENKGRIESGSGWLSVVSQTGILGLLCIIFMVFPNLLFIFRNRSTSYCSAWYSGMCVMFVLQPITEAYITTVGAVLCCLFWLNYSVIDSFRNGLLKESDLNLSIYGQFKLFDKRLKRSLR